MTDEGIDAVLDLARRVEQDGTLALDAICVELKTIESAAASPLLERIAELEAENTRLEGLVYSPGLWRCAKCKFTLVQRNLNAHSGTVTARDQPGDKCPNCDVNLWRVTERENALENYEAAESLQIRLNELEAKLAQRVPLSTAWAEGYTAGIDDERVSEANIGIAGFGAKVNPNRQNPYGATKPEHPDNLAVDAFAVAMKEKLAAAREKGRGGWQECDAGVLSGMLREHVEKGDARDVANFCMFLWSLGYGIAQAPNAQQAEQASTVADAARDVAKCLNERGGHGLDLRHVAMLAHHAQQAEAQEPVSGQARFRGSAWTQCTVEHVQMVQANPEEWKGGYEVRLLFARPQPAQLQRLSEEDAAKAWRSVEDVGDDRRNAMLYGDAIQSELAAKNGAVLK